MMNQKIFIYSVIAGVLATIVFSWLLDPLTKWFWQLSTESALSWFTNLQNSAFKNAAIGKRDWVIIVMLWFGTGIFFGASTAVLLVTALGQRIHNILVVGERVPIFRRVLITITVLSFLFVGYNVARFNFVAFLDLQLNASFSQRLYALSPYIDNIEERRLRSQWSLMTTRADYERINRRLDELATAADLTLPKVLYK